MKLKYLLSSLVCSVFLITSNMKSVAVANELEEINDQITLKVKNLTKRIAASSRNIVETDDPNEVFEKALENYSTEFNDYIDITGLNVIDKETITLPEFDANYVAPKYIDVMHDYQANFEAELTTDELNKVIELRKNNYEFDRYATLNEIRYRNLNIRPRYAHNGPIQLQSAAVASGLSAILLGANLSQTVISAFNGCVTALSTALSSSWIPFVGWVIAVALAVGALIAITVIIVQHWDEIKSVINDIRDWFVEQFGAFAKWITSFFSDAVAKGEESVISSRSVIDGITFNFKRIASTDYEAQCAFITEVRRTDDIYLIKQCKTDYIDIAVATPVSEEFCIKNKTHIKSFSSYTWYQNNARSLIINAGTGYTSHKPDLHLYNSAIKKDLPKYAFKHFHNYNEIGKRITDDPYYKTHSFFGLLYWTPNDDGIGEIHPLSPKF